MSSLKSIRNRLAKARQRVEVLVQEEREYLRMEAGKRWAMAHKKSKLKGIAHTDGSGSWTTAKKTVAFFVQVDLIIEKDFPEDSHASLYIMFNPMEWDVAELGLIYGDERFDRELRAFLQKKVGHIPKRALGYSEQGRQEADYVDYDCTANYAKKILAKYPTADANLVSE